MPFPDPLSVGSWAVILLGIMTVGFLALFVYAVLIERGGPQFEVHSGGFGGGLSGWTISRSMLFLFTAIVLGAMGTTIATSIVANRPVAISAIDKYQSVIRLMTQENVRHIQISVEGHKVVIRGEAPDEAVKGRIWDQIKLVNPALDDVIGEITLPKPPGK